MAFITLVVYCYQSACGAQNDGFQSVSGDFAKNWLNDYLEKNPKSGPASSESGMSASSSKVVSSESRLSPRTGYNSSQEGTIEGLRIGFHLGQMYASAQQGYNISGYNAEVDK